MHQLSQGEDEDFCQLPTVEGWTTYEAVSPQEWKLLGWIGGVGKQHVVQEICCLVRYIAGGGMLLEGILKGGI